MKKILTIIIVVVALQLGVASVASASSGTYHKVKYGETLYSIGRYYGVSPYTIADANGLHNPNYIYAGQVLYIPTGGGDCYHDCPSAGDIFHKVRYGETLFSIGRFYGVKPFLIAKVNNLYNPNFIFAGQVLRIPLGHGFGHGFDHGKDIGFDHGRRGFDRGQGCNTGCDRGFDKGFGHGFDRGQGCNTGCSDNYYGYDYTGYYYGRGDNRYSYTCGFYYNCW